MKTQIIPRRYSPRPGLHHSLLSAHSPAPALPPNTTPLSTLYPSLALSPPSLSLSPTALSLSLSLIFPQHQVLPSCQRGKVWRADSNTHVHTQMHEYTYTKHTPLMQARPQGLCYLCCTHTVVVVCLSFASLCFAWLPD